MGVKETQDEDDARMAWWTSEISYKGKPRGNLMAMQASTAGNYWAMKSKIPAKSPKLPGIVDARIYTGYPFLMDETSDNLWISGSQHPASACPNFGLK